MFILRDFTADTCRIHVFQCWLPPNFSEVTSKALYSTYPINYYVLFALN